MVVFFAVCSYGVGFKSGAQKLAGIPDWLVVEGKLLEKEYLAGLVSESIAQRSLLDKGGGFFKDCLAGEGKFKFTGTHGAFTFSGEDGEDKAQLLMRYAMR
jgi:hypothetical protein